MARWVPFLGLTAFVLTLLLGLARLSQGLVTDDQPELPAGPDGDHDDHSAGRGGGENADVDAEKRPDVSAFQAEQSGPVENRDIGEGTESTVDASVGPQSPTGVSNVEAPTEGKQSEGRVDEQKQSEGHEEEEKQNQGRGEGAERVRPSEASESESSSLEESPVGESSLSTEGKHPSRTAGNPSRAGGEESPSHQRKLTTGALLANVAVTQGLFGGIVLAGALFYEIPAAAFGIGTSPWSTGLPALALGVGFGLLLWGANEASAAVADAAGVAYDEGLREMLTPESTGGWIVLLGVILPLIAVVEEFLFRAAIIGVPAAGFGISPWALAIVSSTAFAFGHGAQGKVGIAVTGGLGFALAGGFILTGSLLVVIVAHYLVNAMEFLVHEWLALERVTL